MNKLEKQIERILKGEREVNAQDEKGDTLLHLAARKGKTETAELLKGAGAQ